LATEVKPDQAQRELDKLQVLMDSGDATDEEQHRYHLAVAQLAVLRRQGNEPH
jgi:F-type H+-transporting ATPase subunit epsilon